MKKIVKTKDIKIKNVNVENVCKFQNETENLLRLQLMEDSEYIQEAIYDTEKKINAIELTKADLDFHLSHTVKPFGENCLLIEKR